MENATLAVGLAFVRTHSTRTRVAAMVAALLLMLTMFALVQHVDTSPAGASPAAVSVGVDNAQINIGQIVCPILIAIRNAFASTPFAGFVTPILNSLLAAFGCAPS